MGKKEDKGRLNRMGVVSEREPEYFGEKEEEEKEVMVIMKIWKKEKDHRKRKRMKGREGAWKGRGGSKD
jgi:hypothetical protein